MHKLTSAVGGHSLLSNSYRPFGSKLKSLLTRMRLQEEAPQRGDVTSLSDLPHDVLLLILGFLDGHALLICKGVRSRKIIVSSPAKKLKRSPFAGLPPPPDPYQRGHAPRISHRTGY